jgi:tetratricopeptide (TPR) repeat protein
MRIGREDEAAAHFSQARKLAPGSPLPFEGLGLLASRRGNKEEAARLLQEAIQRGSTNYLAHYTYALAKLEMAGRPDGRFGRLKADAAEEINTELSRSLELMPDFGPAQHLLGFVDLVQRENLAQAEEHLQRAIVLDPEDESYLLSLAQVQAARSDTDGARQTLRRLRLPYVSADLRSSAEEMLKRLDNGGDSQTP